MGGGLQQIVAYGAQDVYLTGNPQITFWKILYKRHTNFAMESIEVTFNGQADFNKRVTAVINRNADLMFRTYVQVVLPSVNVSASSTQIGAVGTSFRWLNYVGHRLLKQVELEIGGQRIDRQYGDWMQIWTQLSTELGQVPALDSLVGNTHDLTLLKTSTGVGLDATCSSTEVTQSCVSRSGTPAKTLYVPLQFWFCRNPGLAIPLIALQYHEVRLNVDFETWENCVYAESAVGVPVRPTAQSLAAASVYVDYVYLDTEERRRFAQQSHEYLIEQVQYTGAESITSSSNKVQLNFNHPVKELLWVVQRDSFVDCSFPAWLGAVGGQQPFNYSDDFSTEGIIMSLLTRVGSNVSSAAQTAGPSIGLGVNVTDSNVLATGQQGTAGSVVANLANAGSAGTSDAFDSGVNYLLAKVILASGVRCEGKNPVEVCKLQLNGQDRFTEREGSYFGTVQPYQHHTRTPSTGINVYSFALRPEEHQPSGSCNFSRIDKATLQLTVSLNTVLGSNTAQVRVYALNYNVLRVMSGMGGLAYSN